MTHIYKKKIKKPKLLTFILFILVLKFYTSQNTIYAHTNNQHITSCLEILHKNLVFGEKPHEIGNHIVFDELSILNIASTLFNIRVDSQSNKKRASVNTQILNQYEKYIINNFSLLKHGDSSAIQYFSQIMVNYIINNINSKGSFYKFLEKALKENKRIIVTSPPIYNISNSAHLLMRQFVKDLNSYLNEKNYPALIYKPLIKNKPSNPHYSALTSKERSESKSNADLLQIDSDASFKGQYVLLIDDIIITGTSMRKIVSILKAINVSSIFLFTPIHLDSDFGTKYAHAENTLNTFSVLDLHSLIPILQSKHLLITQKMLRVLFDKKNKQQLMTFLIKNVPLNNIALIYSKLKMIPQHERHLLLDKEQYEILVTILNRNGLIVQNEFLVNNWREISTFSINISNQIPKLIISHTTIDTLSQMNQDPDRQKYNRLKLGFNSAIIDIATKMVITILNSSDFMEAVRKSNYKIAITPSAYGSTPTVAYYLSEIIFELLSKQKVSWDIKKVRIVREGGFNSTDYGKASAAQREQMMSERNLYLSENDVKLAKDRLILVVDDSRISGSHEIKIDHTLSSMQINSIVFSYFYQFSNKLRQELPSLESELNHGFIKTIIDLKRYLNDFPEEEMLITARNLKFILDKKNTVDGNRNELLSFFEKSKKDFLLNLYQESISKDGYYQLPQYKDAFKVLEHYLISNNLISINNLRILNQSIAPFIIKTERNNLFLSNDVNPLNTVMNTYSLMKYGSQIDIQRFAHFITQKLSSELNQIHSSFRNLFEIAKSHHLKVILGSPGIRNVGSSSSFIYEYVVNDLNIILSQLNLPTITLIKFTRFNSNTPDYASMDLDSHLNASAIGQAKLPGKEIFENTIFIFADDIFISGTTAQRYLTQAINSGAIKTFSIFGIIVDPSISFNNPSIENSINTFSITGSLDPNILYILNQNNFKPVQKIMKLFFSQENSPYLYNFLNNNRIDFNNLKLLLEAAINSDYEHDPKYQKSILILKDFLTQSKHK